MDHTKGELRMKRTMMIGASLVVLVFIGAVTVMGGQMPMGSQGGEQEHPSGQSSMMGMMCPMMGSQMDPTGMMGMMGGGQTDPKAMGRVLEFRGELLKAMGDVMIKHGQAMSKEQ
jgi:hypothetical protein